MEVKLTTESFSRNNNIPANSIYKCHYFSIYLMNNKTLAEYDLKINIGVMGVFAVDILIDWFLSVAIN